MRWGRKRARETEKGRKRTRRTGCRRKEIIEIVYHNSDLACVWEILPAQQSTRGGKYCLYQFVPLVPRRQYSEAKLWLGCFSGLLHDPPTRKLEIYKLKK